MSELNPTPDKRARKKRNIVVIVAVILLVLALVSAFGWPGWALRRTDTTTDTTSQQLVSASPTVSASTLPSDASSLVSSLPKSVGAFARQDVTATQNWASADPIEEYTVTYSNGDPSQDVTLVFAQWSSADDATQEYGLLKDSLNGMAQAHGNVKVDGETTGQYIVMTDGDTNPTDGTASTALWRNDTVVFMATGAYASVNAFYSAFPM